MPAAAPSNHAEHDTAPSRGRRPHEEVFHVLFPIRCGHRGARGQQQRQPWATYGKIAWRLIPFLVFLFVLAWIDRVNVGFAKLQMLQDLQFSEAVYGLGAGIFFIGYCSEVPSNLLLKKKCPQDAGPHHHQGRF
jgi:hypothetical protein